MRLRPEPPRAPGAACREGWESVAFHVGAPVVARAAVALVDPALRHHLPRMPGRLLFAHVPCVRRPRVGARLREPTRHKQLSPGMLSRRSRERKA